MNKIPTRFIKTEKVAEKRLEANDLVIEISGGSKNQSTGRMVFITTEFLSRYTIPVLFTNFCKTIRVNQDIIDPYYFYLYWSLAYSDELTGRYENQPSGIKNFQLEEFISTELIYLPPKDIQKFIVDMLRPIFEMGDYCNSMAASLKKIEKESFKSIYYGNGNE